MFSKWAYFFLFIKLWRSWTLERLWNDLWNIPMIWKYSILESYSITVCKNIVCAIFLKHYFYLGNSIFCDYFKFASILNQTNFFSEIRSKWSIVSLQYWTVISTFVPTCFMISMVQNGPTNDLWTTTNLFLDGKVDSAHCRKISIQVWRSHSPATHQ